MVELKNQNLLENRLTPRKQLEKSRRRLEAIQKRKKPTISNLEYNTNRKKYEAYMKELNEYNKPQKNLKWQ